MHLTSHDKIEQLNFDLLDNLNSEKKYQSIV